MPSFAIALGGNYFSPPTPDYNTEAQCLHLNSLTESLWRYSIPLQSGQRKIILDEISGLSVPDKFTHVIYKRSYPFKNMNYFPNLKDLGEITHNARVIILRRSLAENAASILRRKFVATIEDAIERINLANKVISKQLKILDGMRVLEISYADLVASPVDILDRIEAFLEFPKMSLVRHSPLIKSRKKSHDLLKKNEE